MDDPQKYAFEQYRAVIKRLLEMYIAELKKLQEEQEKIVSKKAL